MPVRFVCPECHRVLSVTRRKIGYEVACPKCLALVTVPDNGQAAAKEVQVENGPVPEEMDLPAASALAFFDDVPELASNLRPVPVSPVESDVVDLDSANDDRVLITRNAIYLQAILLLLVAATSFGLGYWLGGVDARPKSESPPAAASSSDETTGRTS